MIHGELNVSYSVEMTEEEERAEQERYDREMAKYQKELSEYAERVRAWKQLKEDLIEKEERDMLKTLRDKYDE